MQGYNSDGRYVSFDRQDIAVSTQVWKHKHLRVVLIQQVQYDKEISYLVAERIARHDALGQPIWETIDSPPMLAMALMAMSVKYPPCDQPPS